MVNTKVILCGIEMDNPIIPASGTFGFGYEFAELYDINVLGTFSFKGTTREPRFGNPTPRIAEYAGGLLNAVGLQNPGVDAVIETELPKLKQVFHKPVMANVSGFSVAEYAEVCEKLDAQEQVGWLEVNISCPNVHGGGAAFGADPKSAAEVTKAGSGSRANAEMAAPESGQGRQQGTSSDADERRSRRPHDTHQAASASVRSAARGNDALVGCAAASAQTSAAPQVAEASGVQSAAARAQTTVPSMTNSEEPPETTGSTR